MDDSKFAESLQNLCIKLGINSLKQFQIDVLENVVCKKIDNLVCVPTGSGKTVCFQGITTIYETMALNKADKKIVLVISPLKMLMASQKKKFEALKLESVVLGEAGAMKKIQDGTVRYVQLGHNDSLYKVTSTELIS